jgi:hypothetical protein
VHQLDYYDSSIIEAIRAITNVRLQGLTGQSASQNAHVLIVRRQAAGVMPTKDLNIRVK